MIQLCNNSPRQNLPRPPPPLLHPPLPRLSTLCGCLEINLKSDLLFIVIYHLSQFIVWFSEHKFNSLSSIIYDLSEHILWLS